MRDDPIPTRANIAPLKANPFAKPNNGLPANTSSDWSCDKILKVYKSTFDEKVYQKGISKGCPGFKGGKSRRRRSRKSKRRSRSSRRMRR